MADPAPAPAANPGAPKSAILETQLDVDVIMCIKRAVALTLTKMCSIHMPSPPSILKKPVIKWQGRVRILKPYETKFISVITFQCSESKHAKLEVQGIACLFATEDVALQMLSGLGLKGKLSDDDIMDGFGEFLNVIAGAFKVELANEGYHELEMSTPHNSCGTMDELFNYYKDEKFEIAFTLGEEMTLYLDLALASIPKKTKTAGK